MPITSVTRPPPLRSPQRQPAHAREPPSAQRIAYRQPRSVPPCSNGRPRGCNHARLPMPFDAEDRPPSPPDYTPPGTYHLSLPAPTIAFKRASISPGPMRVTSHHGALNEPDQPTLREHRT